MPDEKKLHGINKTRAWIMEKLRKFLGNIFWIMFYLAFIIGGILIIFWAFNHKP